MAIAVVWGKFGDLPHRIQDFHLFSQLGRLYVVSSDDILLHLNNQKIGNMGLSFAFNEERKKIRFQS